MKKLFKIGIFTSLAFLTLGLGFITAAVALGATWEQLINTVDTREFPFISKSTKSPDSSPQNADSFLYSGMDSLEIELGGGSLELKETDEDQVQVEILSDPSHIVKTSLDDGTLKITAKSTAKRKKADLCVRIPTDLYLDEINLKLGAAAVTAESFETEELEVQLGAGTFTGTGEITADESHWQAGVGELNLDYLDCGDLFMDCGMGSMSVTMAGCPEDFDCDITCGAGAVTVGDHNFTTGNHYLEGDDADGEMEIQCGMGAVDVKFDGD